MKEENQQRKEGTVRGKRWALGQRVFARLGRKNTGRRKPFSRKKG